jgi:hypothetical protein
MAGMVLVAGSAAFLSSRQAEPVLDGADQGVMSLGGRVVPGRDTRPGHHGGHVPAILADRAPEVASASSG